MSEQFQSEITEFHEIVQENFQEYRDRMTEVLFFGERISRSELLDGKRDFIEAIHSHIEALQQVLFPALASSEDSIDSISGIDVLVKVQERVQNLVQKIDEKVDFFAAPDESKEERNVAGRTTLKHLYRFDGILETYFEIVQDIFLEAGDKLLENDEKQKFITELSRINPQNT